MQLKLRCLGCGLYIDRTASGGSPPMVSACIMTLHEQIYQLHWPAVPPSFLADCVRSHKERKKEEETASTPRVVKG